MVVKNRPGRQGRTQRLWPCGEVKQLRYEGSGRPDCAEIEKQVAVMIESEAYILRTSESDSD